LTIVYDHAFFKDFPEPITVKNGNTGEVLKLSLDKERLVRVDFVKSIQISRISLFFE
jgi:hypothetical protein